METWCRRTSHAFSLPQGAVCAAARVLVPVLTAFAASMRPRVQDNAFPSWHPFVITRALENQVFAMSLSRAGSHFGCSVAVPPWLEPPGAASGLQVRTLGDDAAVLPMVVDAAVLDKVRTTYSLRRDRHALFGGAGRGEGCSQPGASGPDAGPTADCVTCRGAATPHRSRL